MSHSYPPPTSLPEEVQAVRGLYQSRYGVILTHDQAKNLLEGVAQFIYLTEIEHALRSVREEVQRE